MDTAFISALSALAGSIIGGLTAGITTWMGHRSQAKSGHRLHNLTQRESLYRDFVIAASEAYGAAITDNEPKLRDLVILHAMVSRMRILSGPDVIASADKTLTLIMDTYFLPNRSLLEIRELMKNGEMTDPLRDFSEISRHELEGI